MSKESHSFSVSVACILDIQRAIILQHLIFLQDGTEDGWAKKSNKAMRETYPYLTPKQLRGALDRMEKDEIIISDFRNNDKSDRTKSYFVTPLGRSIYGKEPFAERANAIAQKGKSDIAKRANQILPKGQMNIEVSYTNIVEGVSSENALAAKSADLKTEIPQTALSPIPPAPSPAPRGWQPVDPTDEIEVMRADDLCKERFVRVERLPLERYGAMLDNFLLKVRSEQHSHNNRRDFRNHFFSWARLTGGHTGQANTAGQPVNPVRPGGIPKNVPVYGS